MSNNGRIIVPAGIRKALDLKPGDEIVIQLEDGSIKLTPIRQAIQLAQKKVRQYVPKGTSLVDDLLQARREEE